ncbi:hypothetical protein [Roseofilum casamattae]|uniref:Uncharacterized protein n=1 Tax=Roseofilum casamattae BLCC-M143 TaxID=3022442 RepID=A0ABT7BT52_9CYAN|nr:hypothetical protein [Roseofilum casamattae]MDJ1181714.1 hypothetical protein [Roseofilum casamattae BLCC-M143]
MCIHPTTLLEERQLTYQTLSEILYLLDDIKRTSDPDEFHLLTEQASQLCIKLRYNYSQAIPDLELDGGIATSKEKRYEQCPYCDLPDVLNLLSQSLDDFKRHYIQPDCIPQD